MKNSNSFSTYIGLVVLVVLVTIGAAGFVLGRNGQGILTDFNLGSYSGAYYKVIGSNTSTAGIIYLNDTTNPIVSSNIPLGPNVDQITLSIFAKSSSSAPSLNITPQYSRDCRNFYTFGGNATNTLTLNSASSTYTWNLPANSQLYNVTRAFTFIDINANCVRYIFEKVGDENMLLYSEAFTDEF